MIASTWRWSDRSPAAAGDKGFYLKQRLEDVRIEYKQYIDKDGQYMPDIRNWKWSPANN